MLIAVTGMQREARLFPQGTEVVISGGENAGLARRIEQAIAKGARAVISVGIGGGLKPGLPVGSVVIAEDVVAEGARYHADADWAEAMAARLPQARRGTIVGVDAIVSQPADKAVLRQRTGALAVDMETHIAASVAAAYELPFAALRAVSDAAEDRLPPAVIGAIDAEGHLRLGAVLASIARNPLQVPALIRTGRGSEAATKSLLRGFDLLGIGFGCPHLG
jgi:adenosylhomocysteine nucleosidase